MMWHDLIFSQKNKATKIASGDIIWKMVSKQQIGGEGPHKIGGLGILCHLTSLKIMITGCYSPKRSILGSQQP